MGLAFHCPSKGPGLGTDSGSQIESRGKFRRVDVGKRGAHQGGGGLREEAVDSLQVCSGAVGLRPEVVPFPPPMWHLRGPQWSWVSVTQPLRRLKDRWTRPGSCWDRTLGSLGE